MSDIIQLMKPDTVYYGTTQHGTKIHRGWPWEGEGGDIIQEGKAWKMRSKCGNYITTYSEDKPAPWKVDGFCQKCFMQDAWEAFVRDMKSGRYRLA